MEQKKVQISVEAAKVVFELLKDQLWWPTPETKEKYGPVYEELKKALEIK